MWGVWRDIGRAAASLAPVLITGEKGTCKEMVARTIHDYSIRNAQRFVAVPLRAMPTDSVGSDLFGQALAAAGVGTFARPGGHFEAARGGTLFLDGVCSLDAPSQAKLLRVIQEATNEMLRGGGAVPQVGTRLIAATDRPVRPGVAGAALREDLYYGLSVIEIEVPPLRAHRSDIPMLVSNALRGTPARAVSEEAMRLLMAYSWPGNVRELCQAVARAALLCGGHVIDVPHLPESLREAVAASPAFESESRGGVAVPAREPASDDLCLRVAIARLEKDLIGRALERAKGNRSAAARLLGVGRPLLYSKLEEYQLSGRSSGPNGVKERPTEDVHPKAPPRPGTETSG